MVPWPRESSRPSNREYPGEFLISHQPRGLLWRIHRSMVKDLWDVKQDKCPAPQIVGWWANFFSSIWAFQLSFRLALINSSQVGMPDSFGLGGFEEVAR